MSKVKKFAIELTNPQQVYYPGQVVEGRVVLELLLGKTFKGILVRCLGKSKVYWTKGSGSDKKTYSDEEVYVDETKTVFGVGEYDEGERTLPEGVHKFPFQFVLPANLPGSFEGDYNCYVRYWLKAQLYKPWSLGKEDKFVFTVGGMLDLNMEPNAMTPIQKTESKTNCCFCCESGPVSASFRIDRTGYVPGESIVCNAEITDNSGYGFNRSNIRLIMDTTYRTKDEHTKVETKQCAQLGHGLVGGNGTDVWSGEKLLVPPLPSSHLPNCSLIDIQYYLCLHVNISGACQDLDVSLDIVIGSVPHRSVLEQMFGTPGTMAEQYRGQPGSSDGSMTPQPVVEPYRGQPDTMTHQPMGFGAAANIDIPPPSYQECMFGKVNTRDDQDHAEATGNLDFAPSYMYYDWMRSREKEAEPPPPPYSSL